MVAVDNGYHEFMRGQVLLLVQLEQPDESPREHGPVPGQRVPLARAQAADTSLRALAFLCWRNGKSIRLLGLIAWGAQGQSKL